MYNFFLKRNQGHDHTFTECSDIEIAPEFFLINVQLFFPEFRYSNMFLYHCLISHISYYDKLADTECLVHDLFTSLYTVFCAVLSGFPNFCHQRISFHCQKFVFSVIEYRGRRTLFYFIFGINALKRVV